MNLTSPSQVKQWCIRNGFHPNRTLGQNFLIDRNILNAIIDDASISNDTRVLEVGPGLGVLTIEMLARGANVTAIEKDYRLGEWLTQLLGKYRHFKLIVGDMLEQNLDELLAVPYDVFISNLPYSCGTRILMDVALHQLAPKRIIIMVQREVAERLAANPGEADRGLTSVLIQQKYDVTLLRSVKPSCFWPRPEIASTVVELRAHTKYPLIDKNNILFKIMVKEAFAFRRKQLLTIFKKMSFAARFTEEQLREIFKQCDIDPHQRAEDLSVEQWRRLVLHPDWQN